MPSVVQRVAERYARSQIQKAQEDRGWPTEALADRRAADEPQQPVQAPDDDASSRRSGSSTSRDSRSIARRVLEAYNQKDKPQEADIEVDGEEMDTDWDESATDWMTAKKAAVRKAIACLMNDSASLPQIGRTVERIVRRLGTVDIYFDDGSFVSATVEDPQPQTSDQAPGGGGCGCKHARCKHAAPTVDMVAAVHPMKGLAGARDSRKIGVKTTRWWSYQTDPPFDLWLLRDVPMNLARDLADFPERVSRLRNPREAWRIAKEFADKSPFQRRR